jgi:NADH-quinone oxidoreductase subunit M
MAIETLLKFAQTAEGQVLLVLALPLVAAAACFLAGRADDGRLARRIAVAFALVHLTLTGILAGSLCDSLQNRSLNRGRFLPIAVPGDTSATTRELPGNSTWTLIPIGTPSASSATVRVPGSDIQLYLGVDGLNLWLLPLASLITLCAVLLTARDGRENPGAFLGWLFVLQLGSIGAFLAFDAVLFFAFFELTLVPALFLIGRYGVGSAKRVAARTFFLYTLLGGSLTLFGLLATVAMNPTPIRSSGSEFLFSDDALGMPKPASGPISFSIPQLMHNVQVWDFFAARERAAATIKKAAAEKAIADSKSPGERIVHEQALTDAESALADGKRRDIFQLIVFLCLMVGFAVKLPIVPFHSWLPAAYSEAPAGITMFLAAVLAKLGAYGILRLALPLCPRAAGEYGMAIFGTLAAIGVVYAALCAFAQSDLKKLAAYSSVSHLGLIALGAFAANEIGIGGAVFHTIAHGLSAGLMFGLLAFLADRYGSLDANRFGGLMGVYPRFSFFMMVAVLAGVGLPGLCNFVGEMAVLSSLFDPQRTAGGTVLVVAAVSGVFLSAWYSLTMVKRVFFGPAVVPERTDGPASDTTATEWSAFALLSLGCLALGLAPKYLIEPTIPETKLLGRVAFFARGLDDTDRIDGDRKTWEAWRKDDNRHAVPEEFQRKGPPQGGPPNRTPPNK